MINTDLKNLHNTRKDIKETAPKEQGKANPIWNTGVSVIIVLFIIAMNGWIYSNPVVVMLSPLTLVILHFVLIKLALVKFEMNSKTIRVIREHSRNALYFGLASLFANGSLLYIAHSGSLAYSDVSFYRESIIAFLSILLFVLTLNNVRK